jgi:hypothetical protein
VKQFLRLPRREVLFVAGAALLSFVITLAIVASGTRGRLRNAEAAQRAEIARTRKAPALSSEELSLAAEDFLLPGLKTLDTSPTYTPFRPRLPRWSRQMVAAWWISPREIALEIVASINDTNMERLLEKVP